MIAGETLSKDFPVTQGAFQTTAGSNSSSDSDGFVSILSANGDQLVASSYLGGNRFDHFEGVASAPDGSLLLTGVTNSTSIAATSGAPQTFNAGGDDGFVARFSSDLSALTYFTYVGGSGDEKTTDIAVGSNGVVGIAGSSTSGDFPTVNSTDSSVQGTYGAIYGRFTPN